MYAKVFSQMYDGSLCTHGPWEALVTFQQMLVLADQEGNVDMTAEAIARRTTIPLNIIKLGIEELLKPDSKSRTPVEEGRRIIPLSSDRDWKKTAATTTVSIGTSARLNKLNKLNRLNPINR